MTGIRRLPKTFMRFHGASTEQIPAENHPSSCLVSQGVIQTEVPCRADLGSIGSLMVHGCMNHYTPQLPLSFLRAKVSSTEVPDVHHHQIIPTTVSLFGDVDPTYVLTWGRSTPAEHARGLSKQCHCFSFGQKECKMFPQQSEE